MHLHHEGASLARFTVEIVDLQQLRGQEEEVMRRAEQTRASGPHHLKLDKVGLIVGLDGCKREQHEHHGSHDSRHDYGDS